MKALFKTTFNSPLGEITITFQENYVTGLNFTDCLKPDNLIESQNEFSLEVLNKLNSYFKGDEINLETIPIKVNNCEFDQRIYKILRKTVYGNLTTYGEIAEAYFKLYHKKISGQAVGSALSRNKILLIIPCHRVIRKDGTLGGFSSGITRKKKLIELERYGN